MARYWLQGLLVLIGVFVAAGRSAAQSWSLAATLQRDGMPMDNSFGAAVASDGKFIYVGADYEKTTVNYAGAIYVFSIDGFAQTERLTLDPPRDPDLFGGAISVQADDLLVGTSKIDRGYITFFTRTDGTWTQGQRIVAPIAADSGSFGLSVELRDDFALVTAPKEAGDTGAVYVYARGANGWSEHQHLVASDHANSDFFGLSLASSGDTLVIGAPGNLLYPSERAGVYIFQLRDGQWVQTQQLACPGPDAPPAVSFGRAIAIDGDTLALSVLPNSDNDSKGRVHVYRRGSDGWALAQTIASPDEKAFAGVSLQRDTLIVGAANGLDRKYYVYTRNGHTWTETDSIAFTLPMGATSTTKLSGSYLLVAQRNDKAGGQVRVYHNADLDALDKPASYGDNAAASEKSGGCAVANVRPSSSALASCLTTCVAAWLLRRRGRPRTTVSA
jgi:hypothetical protein